MVSKLKRPPLEWEKIFASYTLDKGLINQNIQGAQKTKLSKNQCPIKKWTTEQTELFQRKKSKWPKKKKKKTTT
jgi:hypothetical protein